MIKYITIFFLITPILLIKRGEVYSIIYNNLSLLYENNQLYFSATLRVQINNLFRIIEENSNDNISYYYIQHIYLNQSFIFIKNIDPNIQLRKIEAKHNYAKWIIIEVEKDRYKIQNINGCYMKIKESKITCQNITFNEASQFNILKEFEEIFENQLDEERIEKEPIDVIIKYINLRDPTLKRTGIHHIKKDFDNEELRYSIRSILKNIPWIRKIFILMPNDKVMFLKDYDTIKNKIVYIKDKDILGYDSANSLSFQFNYWKMKKFGISDNIIAMDDDCFIGKPLKKSNFFYYRKGKVTPVIITYKFLRLNQSFAKKRLKMYEKIIMKNNVEQSSAEFRHSLYITYSFILKMFRKSLIFPVHTHNAIPINLNELKEVYDIIFKSEFKFSTLDSLYRKIDSLQFQVFYLSYSFIRFLKKVKNISNNLIQNKNAIFADYNYSLFCINTGSIKYDSLAFMESKIVMEYLFPFPSKYEIINNSLSITTFKAIKIIEYQLYYHGIKAGKKIESLKDELNNYLKTYNYFLYINYLFLLSLLLLYKSI